MNNLLLPGRAENMGGGWETRRKRGPGPRLDPPAARRARRSLRVLEVDTNHFKGNYPDRCSVEWIDAPAARITELVASAAVVAPLLPETKLGAHARHFFRDELAAGPSPATHLRVNIFPDGGPESSSASGGRARDARSTRGSTRRRATRPRRPSSAAAARRAGSSASSSAARSPRWGSSMPPPEAVWSGLDRADYLEAFAHHPRLGADPRAHLRGAAFANADLVGPGAGRRRARRRSHARGAARGQRGLRSALRVRLPRLRDRQERARGPDAARAAHGQRPGDRARRRRRRAGEDHRACGWRSCRHELHQLPRARHGARTARPQPPRAAAALRDGRGRRSTGRPSPRRATDEDGRVRSFLPEAPLRPGTYRICFDTKTYLEASGRPVFYPQIDVVFAVDGAAEEHYHIPLLLSPFGYSTYRGS